MALELKPPGAVLEVLNFKIFLGEHTPRPPTLGVLEFLRTIISPSEITVEFVTDEEHTLRLKVCKLEEQSWTHSFKHCLLLATDWKVRLQLVDIY